MAQSWGRDRARATEEQLACDRDRTTHPHSIASRLGQFHNWLRMAIAAKPSENHDSLDEPVATIANPAAFGVNFAVR
ncbi:MAG: hypothetical protein BJG00_012740 [Limnothrix sp. CACIAM 69d]|nr:MAG: hypothetical protein BJG00_012740 [Limnothrix sp. CACIAM 69d]